ncbi:DeoR/GlpR transcriptional regulator, partial [Streptomyces albidoflavus]
KRAALDSSRSAVLVAGSSKFGTFGKYRVAPLADFDAIITDSALTEAAAEGVRDSGPELHLAGPA